MPQHLDYATIRYLLHDRPAPAISLLRLQKESIAFTVSFLEETFRQPLLSRLPHERLLARLEQHVDTYEADQRDDLRARALHWVRQWLSEELALLARHQAEDGQL
jgi:hypothetical protein